MAIGTFRVTRLSRLTTLGEGLGMLQTASHNHAPPVSRAPTKL
jgi:hypothetical protein